MKAKDARKEATDIRLAFKGKELSDILYNIFDLIGHCSKQGSIKTDYSLDAYQEWQSSEIIEALKAQGYTITLDGDIMIIHW